MNNLWAQPRGYAAGILGTLRAASLTALLLVPSSRAAACASCGSGGDEAMVLYPNESQKFYVGYAQARRFRNVNADGSEAAAGGPTRRDTLTLAYGHAFTNRLFTTGTVPILRNYLAGDSRGSWGDPALAARYTAVMPDLTEPWRPQVQLVASYRHAAARSLRESKQLRTQLDVFGSGFSETKLGADLWYGMLALKGGLAAALIVPLARDFDGIRYRPGTGLRTTASLAYMWPTGVKLTAGLNREQRQKLQVAGDQQPDSDQLVHTGFVNADWQLSPQDNVRFGWSRQAMAFQNRNTSRSTAVSMAMMRSL